MLRRTPLSGPANMCFCDGDGGIAGVEILHDEVCTYEDDEQPAAQVMTSSLAVGVKVI